MRSINMIKPNIKKSKNQQGFTLIEVIIASALLLGMMGLTVSFLFDFSRQGNQNLARTTLEEDLRSSLNRMERELLEGSIVASGSTATKLVVMVPLYSNAGFIRTDASGNPVQNTITLTAAQDGSAGQLKIARNTPIVPRLLRFTLSPGSGSQRQSIANQTIARHLMPAGAGSEYLFPDNLPGAASFGGAGTAVGSIANRRLFTYYGRDGSVLDPTTAANLPNISQVRITLWGELNEQRALITAKKELDIRFRNWADPNPPPMS